MATLSAKRRRKMSKAERIKTEKRAKKNRKLRRFRGPWKKSKKGQKAIATTTAPDGKVTTKRIRKKFYFDMYGADGNHMGLYWSVTPRVSKDKLKSYKEEHGTKHPAALPVKRKK